MATSPSAKRAGIDVDPEGTMLFEVTKADTITPTVKKMLDLHHARDNWEQAATAASDAIVNPISMPAPSTAVIVN